jgi:phosphate-selective porin OprO/OprP
MGPRPLIVKLVILGCAFLWTGFVTAQEKSVNEEILDILRDKGQISEEKYEELLKKAEAEKEPSTFRVYWKDGIRIDSRDGRFKFQLTGRIMNDWAVFSADSDTEAFFNENFGSGTEFRRARLGLGGTIYDVLDFKAEYDFADGDADFKDMYVGLRKLPVIGHIKVGHKKEPFSLEDQTSSKYITFMERALPTVFAPGYNTGVLFHNVELDGRLFWGVGGFRETDDFGEGFGEEDEYNITARVTGLPWYEQEGGRLLHLGISYSHKFGDGDEGATVRFRQRPEAHLSPVRFVDTTDIPTDGVDLVTPEAALVFGPFSAQGEYFHASVDRVNGSDVDFDGFYLFVSYFLTGEHRSYSKTKGAFDRVKPKKNFGLGKERGWGAWEIAARYSNLDLTDGSISGGELHDFTLGVNWYLYPNARIMGNYIFADLDDVGETSIFQMRFQVDW